MCSTWCVRVCVLAVVKYTDVVHSIWHLPGTFIVRQLDGKNWRRVKQKKKKIEEKKWSCINAILASQPTHTTQLRWGTFHLLCWRWWATATARHHFKLQAHDSALKWPQQQHQLLPQLQQSKSSERGPWLRALYDNWTEEEVQGDQWGPESHGVDEEVQ